MALTLEAEQRLGEAGLIDFFTNGQQTWTAAAQQTYEFVRNGFPPGSTIRHDDVAKALIPILEVNEQLHDKLAAAKLKQKFWVSHFADLIIDRVWATITTTTPVTPPVP
jgi:hypothetical protein